MNAVLEAIGQGCEPRREWRPSDDANCRECPHYARHLNRDANGGVSVAFGVAGFVIGVLIGAGGLLLALQGHLK